jgi:tetratricopeptide (TPR) repeat protein
MRSHGRPDRTRLVYWLIAWAAFGVLAASPPFAGAQGLDPSQDPEALIEQVSKLELEFETALATKDLPAAITRLKEVRSLRLKLMGLEHWLVRTADLQLEDLGRIEKLDPAVRTKVVSTIGEWRTSIENVEPAQQQEQTARLARLSIRLDELLDETSLQALELKMQCGQAQMAIGQLKEARETMQSAVSRSRKLLGEVHPWYAFSLSLLATADSQLERWDDAKREAALALRANEHLFGEDTPPCGMNYLTLAWIDINRNDFKAARRHADNAISALTTAQEDDPINYTLACSHMARALGELGENESACRQYVEMVKFLDEHKAVPAPLQRDICERYVTLLGKLGKTSDETTIRERIAKLDDSDAATMQ